MEPINPLDSAHQPLVPLIRHYAMLIRLVPKSTESNNAPTTHAHKILIVRILTIAPTLELPPRLVLFVIKETAHKATCALKPLVESVTTLCAQTLTNAPKFRPVLSTNQVHNNVLILSAHKQVTVPILTTAHQLPLEPKFALYVKEVTALLL